jgi:hypothetical protein
MLRPFLLVGVGGSGGKTLRTMQQTLLRRLRQVGWAGDGLPEGWQMLWVDSVSVQSADGFPAPLLDGEDYCGLVPPGTGYQALRGSLTTSVQPGERMSATAGWVAENVPINIGAGAGQSRAIGRVISAAKLERIKNALSGQHSKLVGPTVQAQLADLSGKLGQQPGAMGAPIALVVSSVAGGSGAGMFMDVVEALRSVDPGYNEPGRILTILYTPDVFTSVGQTKQVPANTLGALAEVLTGVWADGLSDASDVLYRGQGLTARAEHGFGSKCNFLVGASNANVSLGSQEEVYRAVGESLSALVVDDRIQENLIAFTLTNVFLKSGDASVVEDRSGLKDPQNSAQSMPFSALGMGRVNLGADRFRQYVAAVVGRDITEALLWPAYAVKDPAQPKPDEELIDEQVALAWEPFRRSSGLDERNPANQVVEALIDSAAQSQRLSAWAQKGVSTARQGVEAKGMQAEEWRQRLLGYYNNFLPAVRAEEEAERYALAQAWAGSIQGQLEELVAQSSLRYGFRVTIKLLEHLIAEVSYSCDELKGEAAALRTGGQQIESKIMQALNVGRAKLPADDAALTSVGQMMHKGAEIEVAADRHDLAARLLDDLRVGLLLPLLQGVQGGYAFLTESVNRSQMLDGRKNPWPVQPRYGETVPSWLYPGGTERVLIQFGDYESILGTQARNSLQDEHEREVWRQVLRTRIALGEALGSRERLGTPILVHSGAWTPRDIRACATGVTGQQASVGFPKSFEDFTVLVDSWLADARLSADLGRFMTQGLRAYVESGTPQEQVARQGDFIAALTAAVNVAAPFARVKPSVVAELHPNLSADGRDVLVSTIPFTAGHPLHAPILEVFRNGRLLTPKNQQQSDSWFATAKVDDISVFTMSGEAMLPMAFDNLMAPIAQAWAQASPNKDQRYSFWSLRRARPLIECIPAGPAQLEAMVRGWFVGRLLGQVTRAEERGMGWRVHAWNPDPPYNGPQPFPFPLLSDRPVVGLDLIAAVLQSLLIAMVDVHTKGNLSPLVPYHRLIELGENYDTNLGDWILDGSLPPGAPTPDPKVAGAVDGPAEDRREAIRTALLASRSEYVGLFDQTKRDNDPFTVPLSWELRDQILAAIDSLTAATNAITSQDSSL